MLSIDRQNHRCHGIRFSEFRLHLQIDGDGMTIPERERVGGRRRTKLVCRTRNGSSPYFCDSSRPVYPSVSGSHYRSMDGRGGKGEKGLSSVRAPPPLVPGSPFSLSPFSHPFTAPLAVLFRSRLSHSLSLSSRLLPSPSLPLPLLAPPCPSVFII